MSRVNRKREADLSHRRVKEILNYEPLTGVFTWRVSRKGNARAGRVAGYPNGDGQIRIVIDGNKFAAHRVAWFWMTGEWPVALLDHKDLDRSNNCWGNLRQATKPQNSANRPAAKNNKSGIKGIFWSMAANKWCAQICVNGRRMHLGVFATTEEASAAYAVAAEKHHGEFARAA